MNGLGILAGLSTAGLWTATAVCFEVSSRRIGSWAVNVLRLAIAALLFVGLSCARTGGPIPLHLTPAMWRDLALSGMIGFVVGDLMLFEAFVLIGSRLSMLIYASVPVATAVAGFLFLGETVDNHALFGMAVTLTGIALAILSNQRAIPLRTATHRRRGILLAIGGSLGQAAGLILGKRGSYGLDSFAATEIRVLAGLVGLLCLSVATHQLSNIWTPLSRAINDLRTRNAKSKTDAGSNFRALWLLLIGAILGPFLGVSLGLTSAQLLPAGVASTLMSIVPALLVPVSAWLFRESISRREIVGTLVTLVGVGILAF